MTRPKRDGVSTAILLFTKTNSGGTDNVWFYDMRADGFSLDDKRTPQAARPTASFTRLAGICLLPSPDYAGPLRVAIGVKSQPDTAPDSTG
jgi:hypothetical protein